MRTRTILESFVRHHRLNRTEDISRVSCTDLRKLKTFEDCSVEDLLRYLAEEHQSLFYGTGNVYGERLQPNGSGKLYSTDLASIAIMKAVVSNRNLKSPGLECPLFIDEENPLEVKVHWARNYTIRHGVVCVINTRDGFENDPEGSWQFVSKKSVPISAIIPVQRADFRYPIFDVDKNIEL